MSAAEIEELEKEVQQTGGTENSYVMTVNVTVVIKEQTLDIGIVNNDNDVEGIKLYTRDMFIAFKQLPFSDLTFEVVGSLGEFGIDLFRNGHADESVVVGNKRIFPQSLEDQWRVKVRKRPEEMRNVDFDIELYSNPFVVIYNKEFFRRVYLILAKLGINEEYQNAAIDKIEDLREATSNQIYQIVYKKANRLRVNIASPVILLPLSASAQSPVWVLRLGDFQLVSAEQMMSTAVQEYERYEILVDSIRMQYYSSMEQWRNNLEGLKNFRDKTVVREKNEEVFSVLEDCWVKFSIGIKQKKAGLLMMSAEQMLEH